MMLGMAYKRGIVVLGLLLIAIGSAAMWVSQRETHMGSNQTPVATMRGTWYHWSDVTYSYEQTHAPSVEMNPDWVTHWITPAPVTAVQGAAEWNPTAQEPGLSTLAPWQTPNPTLICLTNCR